MDTWPIAAVVHADRLWLGIPDHLGAAGGGMAVDALPTLEERCGEDWSEQLLGHLLPAERTWAWWTRNAVFRDSKVAAANAPARIVLDAAQVLRRNVWMRQMSLCVIPPTDTRAQRAVLHWAGLDTEQIPDQLWAARSGTREWNLEEIADFCNDHARWSDPAATAAQPAERIVVLFDRHVYCALDCTVGEHVRHELDALAERWGLRTIAGPPERAWVMPPG